MISSLKGSRTAQVFIGLTVLFVAIIVFFYFLERGEESTDDAQIEGLVADVYPQIQGRVSKVLVKNYQFVKKGELLVSVEEDSLKIQKNLAKADFAAARAGLESSFVDIKKLKSNLTSAKNIYELSRKNLRRVLELKKQGAIAQSAVDEQQTKFDTDKARLDAAKAQLAMSEKMVNVFGKGIPKSNLEFMASLEKLRGLNPEVDASIAKVKKAQAALDNAELNLQRCQIAAPMDGYVANKNVNMGKSLDPSLPLMSIVSLQDIWVTGNFKEDQVQSMKINQPVKITVDAFSGVTLDGVIEQLSPATGSQFALIPPDNASGNFVKVTQRIPVRIRITKIPEGIVLRQGMSAQVTVHDMSR